MARTIRISLIISLLSAALYFGANFLFRVSRESAIEADVAYIAKHCIAVPNIGGDEIALRLVIDSSFDGILYIFDGDQFIDDVNAFEVAWRGILSEVLCVPLVGCLLAPRLSHQCASEIE